MVSKIDPTSLREEIALMRMCIEARFNLCADNAALMEQAPLINAQMMILEKLISTEHKFQKARLAAIDAVMKTAGDVAHELVGVVIQAANLTDVEINAIANKVAARIKAEIRRGTK